MRLGWHLLYNTLTSNVPLLACHREPWSASVSSFSVGVYPIDSPHVAAPVTHLVGVRDHCWTCGVMRVTREGIRLLWDWSANFRRE